MLRKGFRVFSNESFCPQIHFTSPSCFLSRSFPPFSQPVKRKSFRPNECLFHYLVDERHKKRGFFVRYVTCFGIKTVFVVNFDQRVCGFTIFDARTDDKLTYEHTLGELKIYNTGTSPFNGNPQICSYIELKRENLELFIK